MTKYIYKVEGVFKTGNHFDSGTYDDASVAEAHVERLRQAKAVATVYLRTYQVITELYSEKMWSAI